MGAGDAVPVARALRVTCHIVGTAAIWGHRAWGLTQRHEVEEDQKQPPASSQVTLVCHSLTQVSHGWLQAKGQEACLGTLWLHLAGTEPWKTTSQGDTGVEEPGPCARVLAPPKGLQGVSEMGAPFLCFQCWSLMPA